MKRVKATIFLTIVCGVIVTSLNAVQLPPYFIKCRKNDPQLNKCIYENIKHNYLKFAQGDVYYHIRKMDPLFVPQMHVKVDNNLYGNLTNGNIVNLDSYKVKSVEFDLVKKHWNIYYTFPWNTVHGDYDVKGRLFGLPITGQGYCNVTAFGGNYNYSVDFKLNKRKGKHYIQIINSIIHDKNIENMIFNIRFSQNTIGKALSDVLNSNWESVGSDIRNSIGFAIAQVMSAVLQGFFDRVPWEEFFQPE